MSEQKPEKRVVSRAVAIALGIVSMTLAVCIVVAIANYTTTIDNITTSKDSQISNLQSQINDLTDTLSLFKSTIWVNHQTVIQLANSSTKWAFAASYAGYVYVDVITQNPSNYIRVIYHSYADYDNQIGKQNYTESYGIFPILPSSNVQIMVGNTNPNGWTGTVTITYYY